jgi:hypothetical protein
MRYSANNPDEEEYEEQADGDDLQAVVTEGSDKNIKVRLSQNRAC